MNPFQSTWWVKPNQLLAGCYPGDSELRAAEAKLKALMDAGIQTFISLMEEDETDKTGDPFAPYEPALHALAGEVDVRVHRFAIQDMGVFGFYDSETLATARTGVYILSAIFGGWKPPLLGLRRLIFWVFVLFPVQGWGALPSKKSVTSPTISEALLRPPFLHSPTQPHTAPHSLVFMAIGGTAFAFPLLAYAGFAVGPKQDAGGARL